MSTTAVLAIWGALLSTFTLGWNLYRDMIDRGRLKISAHVRRLARGADGKFYAVKPDLPIAGASEGMFTVITAVNIGRRPLVIKGWGGKYRDPVNGKRSFSVIAIDIPKLLKEGEDHSEFTNEILERLDNIERIFVWDASGKKWSLSKTALKKLKKEARQMTRHEAASI